MLELVVVDPLGARSQDPAVCHSILEVRFHLKELVRGAELASVLGAAITDHDLGRVLVWHHNGWLGQAGSEGTRVVRLQGLLDHASMNVVSLLVNSPNE